MWINIHDLKMINPCQKVLLYCKGLSSAPNKREETPTMRDFRNTLTACIEAGAPQIFSDLYESVYLSRLRIGEVLCWEVEDFCLDLVRDESGKIIELPYVKTLVEKQGHKEYQENPMSYEFWQLMIRVIGDRKTGKIWPWKNPPYHIWEKNEIQKLAGTEHLRPYHDNRKSFKKQLKKEGVAKIYTKYLQGQKTDSMDDYYTCYQRLDAQDAFMDGYE